MLQEAGHIKNSYFDFPAHSRFIFDEFWGSLGTSIFGKWSSAASNTRSWLPSRLSFRFLWLWYKDHEVEIVLVKEFCRTHTPYHLLYSYDVNRKCKDINHFIEIPKATYIRKQLKSSLRITRRDYRHHSKCNYLKNQKHFTVFILFLGSVLNLQRFQINK